MKICVFGAASNQIEKHYIDAVEGLCESLGSRGHDLVFGAGANGLMGAAARGFHKGGGKVIGVVPRFFRTDYVEDLYEKCDKFIYTDDMAQRKSTMEDLAEAYIIVPGGIGTFDEFFEVLTLKQLNRHNKTIAMYDVKDYYNSIETLLDNAIKEHFLHENCLELFKIFEENETKELIDYVEADPHKTIPVNEVKYG